MNFKIYPPEKGEILKTGYIFMNDESREIMPFLDLDYLKNGENFYINGRKVTPDEFHQWYAPKALMVKVNLIVCNDD